MSLSGVFCTVNISLRDVLGGTHSHFYEEMNVLHFLNTTQATYVMNENSPYFSTFAFFNV